MEVAGTVGDFYRAVRRIPGFEYLAEIDETDVAPDDAIYDPEDPSATLDASLYLLSTNQTALSRVLELWDLYQRDESARFPQGLAKWKDVFRLLIDLRRWSANDRLQGTGVLEDFRERLSIGQEVIPAEIELWYRGDELRRSKAEERVRELVRNSGGQVVSSATIAPIAYHALLVELPITTVQSILANTESDVALIRAEEIAFVRPEAQAAVALAPPDETNNAIHIGDSFDPEADPLVAVLDGLPVGNHSLLGERIQIDDPDDWAAEVPLSERRHGTAVTSLVVHGDISDMKRISLRRPVHVRPVLYPHASFDGTIERIPARQMAIDLVHRAVLRMVSPDGVAPSVRLINLSVGDSNVHLAAKLSPWARLLDWLSYAFNVVFVVSAGNHAKPILYPLNPGEIEQANAADVRSTTLDRMIADAERRRLLSPSEAINAICVGATHFDYSREWVRGRRFDLLPDGDSAPELDALPSPISSVGMGYRRSIKPDLLAPGGRMLYRERPGSSGDSGSWFDPVSSAIPPGLQTASVGAQSGELNAVRSFVGTSGAAAVVSHFGGIALEALTELETTDGGQVDPRFYAVLTKSLIVHSCSIPQSADLLRRKLEKVVSAPRLREALSRFYGYGVLDRARIMGCESSRATVLGWGEIKDGEGQVYNFPLPPSLSGKAVHKRLTLTVAYLAPTRVRDRRHRAAEVYLLPRTESLRLERSDSQWQAVRRGTIQHEVFRGDRAAAFIDGDNIAIQVNCRSLVGRLPASVLYGLAVSLDVAPQTGLPIYQEVAARVRVAARARVRGT
jgi:hypothetical protein